MTNGISVTNTGSAYLETFGVSKREYALALENFKHILKEAREVYAELVGKGKLYMMNLDNFSKLFIEKASIVNETTIRIGNELYRYVVFHVYNTKNKFLFDPKKLMVNGIEIRLLPRNRSVTYTGGLPYSYLIMYGSEVCRVRFFEIGFVTANYNLLGSTINPCNGIYVLRISVNKDVGCASCASEVWLVLVKKRTLGTNVAMMSTRVRSYDFVVKNFESVLSVARKIYLDALKRGKARLLDVDSFSRMLILNGSVVNSSVLRVGNTFYRFIIVRLVGENRLYFMPKKVKVGNIEVEMLPRNKSVTYTGMLPYEYAMKFDGKHVELCSG